MRDGEPRYPKTLAAHYEPFLSILWFCDPRQMARYAMGQMHPAENDVLHLLRQNAAAKNLRMAARDERYEPNAPSLLLPVGCRQTRITER